MMKVDFSKSFTKKMRSALAEMLINLSEQIGFKVSSRGWCYLMEQSGLVNKDQFNKVESAVNRLRKDGDIPVDFVAEEDARMFKGVESASYMTMRERVLDALNDVQEAYIYQTPEYWEGEEYYIQMLVEKIDLVTLFQPVCRDYKIPIANSKGWSSILQRAEYTKRFQEAEQKGLKCVLLYCGDHDPDGLRISDTIRKNLYDVAKVQWSSGFDGYDPSNLIIDRFGLNYDFIIDNDLSWIDNLMTGRGKNLANPDHPNHKLPYIQDYLKTVGERKCEANAIVTTPKKARALCREAIESYLGNNAEKRFRQKDLAVKMEYTELLRSSGIQEIIDNLSDDFASGDLD